MEIISRASWAARPHRGRSALTQTADPTLHYNGANELGFSLASTQAGEAEHLRAVQNFHMDHNGWRDIAYNFAVAPSGRVYELRGKNIRNGANGFGEANRSSHAIYLLLGGTEQPSNELIESVRGLRTFLGRSKVQPHSSWVGTSCPGGPTSALISSGTFDSGAGTVIDPPADDPPVTRQTIRLGRAGSDVSFVQTKLGLTADGIFGFETRAAVKAFQISQDITVDGIVGPQTYTRLDTPAPAFTPTVSNWLPVELGVGEPDTAQHLALTRVWAAALDVEQPDGFNPLVVAATLGFQSGVPALPATGRVDSTTWGTRFAG